MIAAPHPHIKNKFGFKMPQIVEEFGKFGGILRLLENSLKICQKIYWNIIYMFEASLPGSSVLTLDCHCNQLLGTPENMNDWGQEMMQCFQNDNGQLIWIVNPIVFLKLKSDVSFLQKMKAGFWQLKY